MARSRRSQAGRRRILPAVLAAALIVLVPLAILVVGRYTDAFAVHTISVSGARRIPEARVEKLLRDEYVGQNLFLISVADVRRTLAEFNYLAAVEIDRDFPTTLRVRLVEFEPALFTLSKGRWFVLSPEGRVVADLGPSARSVPTSASPTPHANAAADPSPAATASQGASPAPTATAGAGGERSQVPGDILRAGPVAGDLRLPVLRTDAQLTVGATVSDQRLLDALSVLRALSPSLRRDATFISTEDGAVLVDFARGLEVAFGVASDIEIKMVSLEAVLGSYAKHRLEATFVDVSVPSRPIARPVF